jgi:hypothetical protein
MFTDWISFTLGNFALVMLILAVLIAIIDWPIQKFRRQATAYDIFYRWVALLPLGVTGFYTCIMHVVLPSYTAAHIGWQTSPFQFEVGMADLAFGLIGFLSFNASYGFRLATVIGSSCWLLGDAVGHIYQMITQHNFTVGNAGSWLWMDLLIPFILIICITKLKPNMPIQIVKDQHLM